MLIGLRRALVRVVPGVLLLAVGLIAILFRGRGRPPKSALPESAQPPIAMTPPGPAQRQGGLVLVVLALLIGIGVILALSGGDGTLSRLVMRPSIPGTTERPMTIPAHRPQEADIAAPVGSAVPGAPTFDTVRVEPNGDLVVAGRGTPNGTVDILVDGKSVAQAVADADGRFAVVPPALPAGNSEIGLRATDARGIPRSSPVSVAVVVSPARDARPLVALTAPDRPTVVLSQPDRSPSDPDSARMGAAGPDGAGATTPGATAKAAPAEGAPGADGSGAPVTIVSVDARDGGRLFVTGRSAAGSTVRLYLNDTLIAPASVGRDGTVTFTIGRGIKPGAYTVRLDQVEAASGKVRSRVEVPFAVPESQRNPERMAANLPAAAVANPAPKPSDRTGAPPEPSPPQRQDPTGMTGTPPERTTGLAGAGGPAVPDPSQPGPGANAVFVPEVNTARIARGDSLWEISRRTYGAGDRYTVIYDANQDQIRNPDLIYPGQIFVLPSEDATEAGTEGKRG